MLNVTANRRGASQVSDMTAPSQANEGGEGSQGGDVDWLVVAKERAVDSEKPAKLVVSAARDWDRGGLTQSEQCARRYCW